MVQTPPRKVFWGGFKGQVPSQEVLGPLGKGLCWRFQKAKRYNYHITLSSSSSNSRGSTGVQDRAPG